MTLQDLHNIPDFRALFEDTRFRACLVYLRAEFPRRAEASGEEWRGRYDVLSELENLKPALPREIARTDGPKRLYPDVPGLQHSSHFPNNQPAA